MKKLTILFLLAICGPVFAGHQTKSFLIQFSSDKHALDQTATQKLDEVCAFLAANPSAKIKLTGRTDFVGTTGYNITLSRLRTNEVAAYLKSKGWAKAEINEKWVGENKPLANNNEESGKALNRSVEILVTIVHYANADEWLREQQKGYEKVYFLKNSGDNTIITDNETVLNIPKQAFIGPDGKPVDNKNIKVVIKEVSNPLDAIINQVFTTSGDQLLETGGMISIEAFSNDKQLKLAEGKDLNIKIPSESAKTDMFVFEGVTDNSGKIDWKNTGKPFSPNAAPKRPTYKLNETVLQSLIDRIQADKPVYRIRDINYTLPVVPKAPSKPKEPKKPVKPEAKELYTSFGWFFSTKSMREKAVEKVHMSNMSDYNKRMSNYSNRLEKYEALLLTYAEEVEKYNEDKKRFYAWATQIRESIESEVKEFQEYHDKLRVIGGLKKLLARSKKGVQYDKYPLNSLKWEANDTKLSSTDLSQFQYLVRLESRFATLGKTHIDFIRKDYSKDGVLDISDNIIPNSRDYNYYSNFYKNHFLDTFIAANKPDFVKVFGDGVKEAMEIAAREKQIEKAAQAQQYFTGNSQKMGWINCDRFVNQPMVRVYCPTVPGACQVVILNDINSVLNTNSEMTTKMNYASIPANKKFKLLTLKIEGDQGYLAINESIAMANLNLVPKFEKMPLEKINEILAKL